VGISELKGEDFMSWHRKRKKDQPDRFNVRKKKINKTKTKKEKALERRTIEIIYKELDLDINDEMA
jgi:DNA-binding Xre family transcriptional regulator